MGGRPAGVVGEVRPAPGPATDLDRPTAVSDDRCPWPSAGSDGRAIRFGGRPPIEADGR